jgi:hypothetical protein
MSKFIALLVNMVFALIGLAFVTIYAAKVRWSIASLFVDSSAAAALVLC